MAQGGNDLTNNYLGSVRPAMSAAQRAAITAPQYALFPSIAASRTYLLANGYTNAQLDIMNSNDIDFAVRRKQGLR